MLKSSSRVLILFITILCFTYLLISISYQPIVASDAMSGFVSLHNHLNGASWNTYFEFDPATAKLKNSSMTWWAPGQYELPYMLSKIVNGNIGLAISLLLFLSVTAGCYFYYKLFQLSKLPANLVLSTLIILLLQRFINIFFIQYSSSDLFLFFYCPFYIFSYFKIKSFNARYHWLSLLLLMLLNMGGLLIKNGFLLFSVSFNVFLLIDCFWDHIEFKVRPGSFDVKKLLIFLPFLVAVLLNYWFFLRLGSNPTDGAGLLLNFSSLVDGVFSGISGVLFSGLSATAIYGNLPPKYVPAYQIQNLIMLVVVVLVCYLIYKYKASIITRLKTDKIFLIAVITSVMYVIFWFLFTIKQSAISNEDRLFLPASILILPYIINFVLKAGKPFKYLAITIISFSLLYGVGTLFYRIKKYSAESGSSQTGDVKLKGFRVYVDNANEVNELDSISKIISANYKDQYILSDNSSDLFLLRVSNKYVLVGHIPENITGHNKYLFLTGNKQVMNSSEAWSNVYNTKSYYLYLKN